MPCFIIFEWHLIATCQSALPFDCFSLSREASLDRFQFAGSEEEGGAMKQSLIGFLTSCPEVESSDRLHFHLQLSRRSFTISFDFVFSPDLLLRILNCESITDEWSRVELVLISLDVDSSPPLQPPPFFQIESIVFESRFKSSMTRDLPERRNRF